MLLGKFKNNGSVLEKTYNRKSRAINETSIIILEKYTLSLVHLRHMYKQKLPKQLQSSSTHYQDPRSSLLWLQSEMAVQASPSQGKVQIF